MQSLSALSLPGAVLCRVDSRLQHHSVENLSHNSGFVIYAEGTDAVTGTGGKSLGPTVLFVYPPGDALCLVPITVVWLMASS